jgi:uncharacterized protein with PQ loop repeat
VETIIVTPLGELIGAASGTLGVALILPQLIKAVRGRRDHGQVVGVSLATWALMLAMYAAWFGVSLRWESPSQTITNLLAVALTIPLVLLLKPARWRTPVILAVLGAAIIVPAAVTFYAPTWFTTAFLAAFLTSRVFQVIASYKTWRNGHPGDVSTATWVISSVSQVGWMTYGTMTGLWLNIVFSLANLILNLLIVGFERGAARTARKNRVEGAV